MNIKLSNILRNFSYTLVANFLSMIISIVLILIVPKFISAIDYGYWQLYIFYSSYTAYMSFGLTDGIYLRYGGKEYSNLNKPVFVSQFWLLVLFNILVYFIIIISYINNAVDYNKIIVVLLACISGILVVPRSLLNFTLQATNRIKEYSLIILIERLSYFILVILFLTFGLDNFEHLIISDIAGKSLSILYAFYVSKELVIGKMPKIYITLNEIKTNISVGSKLLIANLASLLIIGIVRFFIERNWGVETFGKISLTLSISNMLMIFINAVSIVLFPTLRRTSRESLAKIYKTMSTILMVILFGLLILYYPAEIILSNWLPHYTESLIYLGLLFPMCIFESKTSMLINTYLKTLRKENMMLIFNLITVCLSFLVTIITIYILNDLNLTILSIVALLAFRSIISELYVSKILNINLIRNNLFDIFLTMAFISITWFFNFPLGFILYLICYTIYLLIKSKEIANIIRGFKIFSKGNI
ncbi:oligosaccharide flippase family protein [Caldibacillus thermoamylovorans]|uniref:oligosaccharide flippase family protein n=1 Tax=Caldibacillus thermoamylovorans TaxID=35841 RepID=UPI001FD00D04|nr:oligosaccharide flippase family protein [Caldibacillus thermoamylovorans]MCM3054278.1 oligosaccharide flippase family protein [Caldibacillus thermoamylovorans]